jgi:hypothetical protein
VYVDEVAPLIGVPSRSHCHVVAGVGLPVTDAAVAVRVLPSYSVPEIVGTPVMDGAARAAALIVLEVAESEPPEFVTLTSSVIAAPASASTSV